jgi:uncharacterized membrane protein
MAFCSACGARIDEAAFCPNCGAQQSRTSPHPITSAPPQSTGMSENVAATLAYSLGWITGIIFYLIDKRTFVKFHAAQSMVVFGGLHIVQIILGSFLGISFFSGGFHFLGAGFLLFHLLHVIGLVLWILLMVKAYQGERFKVPIAYELAEGIAGKSS